jgi:hypothetical protein
MQGIENSTHIPHASVHVGSSKRMKKKLECVRMILAANYRIMHYKWKKVKWCGI